MAAPKVAVDIRNYLVDTVGLSSVNIDGLTPTPINQYAVVEFAGPPNIKTHGSAGANKHIVLDEANIQIMARHTSAQTARTNIMAVVDALDGLEDVTINSTVYTFLTGISRPRKLTTQEDGSVIFIWEVRCQARR